MEIEELKEILKEPKEFNYIALLRLEEIRNELREININQNKLLELLSKRKEREGVIG